MSSGLADPSIRQITHSKNFRIALLLFTAWTWKLSIRQQHQCSPQAWQLDHLQGPKPQAPCWSCWTSLRELTSGGDLIAAKGTVHCEFFLPVWGWDHSRFHGPHFGEMFSSAWGRRSMQQRLTSIMGWIYKFKHAYIHICEQIKFFHLIPLVSFCPRRQSYQNWQSYRHAHNFSSCFFFCFEVFSHSTL